MKIDQEAYQALYEAAERNHSQPLSVDVFHILRGCEVTPEPPPDAPQSPKTGNEGGDTIGRNIGLPPGVSLAEFRAHWWGCLEECIWRASQRNPGGSLSDVRFADVTQMTLGAFAGRYVP